MTLQSLIKCLTYANIDIGSLVAKRNGGHMGYCDRKSGSMDEKGGVVFTQYH